ncbi:MAG: hypothetical protein M3O70_26910 [Actinomycetota bacterium]|nr:hypothetical protein [Actinomycetota bacterium]
MAVSRLARWGRILIPPNDPCLRQVDRTLLVPDNRPRQQVWRALWGTRGAAVDGEVAGPWHYRHNDHESRLPPSTASTPRTRGRDECHLIAKASDDDEPTVIWA